MGSQNNTDAEKSDGFSQRIQTVASMIEVSDKMESSLQRIVQPYREFERCLAGLSAVVALPAADLEELGKVARKVGVESGFGAGQAVSAFGTLASAFSGEKLDKNSLVELQKQSVTLAQAVGISLDEAAGALGSTMSRFRLSASDAGRVINVLAAGAQAGDARVGDLAESLRTIGSTASEAGLSVEQTTAALEVLSRNDQKGAGAGMALRQMLGTMQRALGVDFRKISLSDALAALQPMLTDTVALLRTFGAENVDAAQFLIRNAQAVGTVTQQVTDTATATATDQAATRTDNWNHRLEVQAARFDEWSMKLTESSKCMLDVIQVGSRFGSMVLSFAPLAEALWSIGEATVDVVRGMKGTATAGKAAAFGIWLKNAAISTGNALLVVYNALTSRAWWVTMAHSVATKASALWTAVCSKAQLVASAVTSLWSKRTALATLVQGGLTKALRLAKVTMMTGVIPALTSAIASTWAWTAALLANPITWIVLGIIALVAAIAICWDKFAGFRAVVYTIWDTIKGFGQAIIDWMIAPFKAAGALIGGLAGAVGKVFSGDWGGAWDSLKEGFGGAADAFTKPVKEAVDTARGIGGNYRMHLTEEQAKQAEKERAKEERKQAAQPNRETASTGSALPDWQALTGSVNSEHPELAGFGAPFGDLDMEQMDLSDLDPKLLQGMELPMGGPEMTGYVASEPVSLPSLGRDAGAGSFGMPLSAAPTVQVDFKPTVHISGDMSRKSRDELMDFFRQFAGELTRIINEENRKNNRGNYGIPALG
ncbi:phage tail tape measure protein [uncultured Rikenella sp.]|uniref:phage tail tape measure protein n=1 Tax=uncultured Rikenella sp. TaxID=368003 RepID=UPI002604B1E5|nr:phage tail tape measure protein [uncultured Rikenella sp.]